MWANDCGIIVNVIRLWKGQLHCNLSPKKNLKTSRLRLTIDLLDIFTFTGSPTNYYMSCSQRPIHKLPMTRHQLLFDCSFRSMVEAAEVAEAADGNYKSFIHSYYGCTTTKFSWYAKLMGLLFVCSSLVFKWIQDWPQVASIHVQKEITSNIHNCPKSAILQFVNNNWSGIFRARNVVQPEFSNKLGICLRISQILLHFGFFMSRFKNAVD